MARKTRTAEVVIVPSGSFSRFLAMVAIAGIAIAILIAALILGLSMILTIWVALVIALVGAVTKGLFARPRKTPRDS